MHSYLLYELKIWHAQILVKKKTVDEWNFEPTISPPFFISVYVLLSYIIYYLFIYIKILFLFRIL